MPSADEQSDAVCAAKVTALLNEAAAGDPLASAQLLPLVYDELRALAGRRMRQERPDQTLQATALVHEAYLRLVDTTKVQRWDSRWHFFAAAAEAMRRILVDGARRRGQMKRGGGLNRVELDTLELSVNEPPDELAGGRSPLQNSLDTGPNCCGASDVCAGHSEGMAASSGEHFWSWALLGWVPSLKGSARPPSCPDAASAAGRGVLTAE